MKKFRIGIVAMSFLHMACFKAESHVIVIQSDDPIIIAASNESARQWNACGKEQLLISTDASYSGDDAIPLTITSPGFNLKDENGKEVGGQTFWGFYSEPTSIQIRNFAGYYDAYRLTISHEFGHVLTGRAHQPTGIMRADAKIPDDTVITQSDCNLIQ